MIDHVKKDVFLADGTYKQIKIVYDGGEITNSQLHYEEFGLTESLCSESQLKLGTCEAAVLKFRIVNPFDALIGKDLTVSIVLDEDTENPFMLGEYKVYSDKPCADRSYRDIVAYDKLYDIINADVSKWYNNLFTDEDSTISLKEFRNAFFEMFGVEQKEIFLINDSLVVSKTIDGAQITGKIIINAICEINGCFGHIGRNGKFEYVHLANPDGDTTGKEIASDEYRSFPTYEDYDVKKITGLQIKTEENDVGVTVGTEENKYVIQDNFLVYGKNSEELTDVANNIFNVVKDITYNPFTVSTNGDPTAEVGDLITVNAKTVTITSYILNRTLSGIQGMKDAYEAKGEESYKENSNSVVAEIKKLKGKSNILERTIEETKSTIADVEKGLKSEIKQSAEEITLEVAQEIDDIQIGAKNLIRNSNNLIYPDYGFADPSLVVTDDGKGNVDVQSDVVTFGDDGDGGVVLTSELYDISDDGTGTTTIDKKDGESVQKSPEMSTLTMGGKTYEVVDKYARDEVERLSKLPARYTKLPDDGIVEVDAMYFLGELTSLAFGLPDAKNGDMVYITFSSGSRATTLDVSTTNHTGLEHLSIKDNASYELIGLYNTDKWVFVTNEV